jgi:hypothetical protein
MWKIAIEKDGEYIEYMPEELKKENLDDLIELAFPTYPDILWEIRE